MGISCVRTDRFTVRARGRRTHCRWKSSFEKTREVIHMSIADAIKDGIICLFLFSYVAVIVAVIISVIKSFFTHRPEN